MLSCSVQMLFYLYAYMLVCVVPEGPAKTPTGCFQALWTGSQEGESVSTADSPVGRETTGQAALRAPRRCIPTNLLRTGVTELIQAQVAIQALLQQINCLPHPLASSAILNAQMCKRMKLQGKKNYVLGC